MSLLPLVYKCIPQIRVQSHCISTQCSSIHGVSKLHEIPKFWVGTPLRKPLDRQYSSHRENEKAKAAWSCLWEDQHGNSSSTLTPTLSAIVSLSPTHLKRLVVMQYGQIFSVRFCHHPGRLPSIAITQTCLHIRRADQEVEYPRRRKESGYRVHLLQHSCQRRKHSVGGDVIYLCLSACNQNENRQSHTNTRHCPSGKEAAIKVQNRKLML